jgi:hypothetical protein
MQKIALSWGPFDSFHEIGGIFDYDPLHLATDVKKIASFIPFEALCEKPKRWLMSDLIAVGQPNTILGESDNLGVHIAWRRSALLILGELRSHFQALTKKCLLRLLARSAPNEIECPLYEHDAAKEVP